MFASKLFERSTIFQGSDDSAYTNRIVNVFAKLKALLFQMNGSQDLKQEGAHHCIT